MLLLQPIESANRSLQRLASVDGLTGAFNKRYFDVALGKRVAEAGRLGEDLTLAMIDPDHFKRVNGAYGHPVVIPSCARPRSARVAGFDASTCSGGSVAKSSPCSARRPMPPVHWVTAGNVLAEIGGTPFRVAGDITASLGVAQLMPGECLSLDGAR